MIGLVVVAHAKLAAELINAAEMIVGPIDGAVAVEIKADDSVDTIRSSLTFAMQSVSADGIIMMTDMFGGTPSNMSLSFLEDNRVEVLTGVNLPMLIKFASDRNRYQVADLAAQIRDCGRDGVTVAGDYLKK
ncbi:MAG TPA: PTS sugar transporter [Geobacteraceae bacterium]|nr:PTS sugar transporter [Geobacteraceae bacterium]